MTFYFIWFNVSRIFIPHTYTQNSLHFNSLFSLFALLPLYIYIYIYIYIYLHATYYVIPYQIHTDKKRCHLPSIFQRHLSNSNIVSHFILTCMSWLQLRKGGLHFILSDNDNYDFDIKVGRCGLWVL